MMFHHRDNSHIPSAALLGGATLGEDFYSIAYS